MTITSQPRSARISAATEPETAPPTIATTCLPSVMFSPLAPTFPACEGAHDSEGGGQVQGYFLPLSASHFFQSFDFSNDCPVDFFNASRIAAFRSVVPFSY